MSLYKDEMSLDSRYSNTPLGCVYRSGPVTVSAVRVRILSDCPLPITLKLQVYMPSKLSSGRIPMRPAGVGNALDRAREKVEAT